jgi:ATP-dependent helicase/nuclease subunit A
MATRLSRNLSAWAVISDAQLSTAIEDLTGEMPDDDRLRAARRLFARVLDAPGGIKIQTIHAFCQALLKRFPVEAEVAPHFTVLEERDALDLLGEVQRALLATAMPGPGHDPAIASALSAVTGHASEAGFAELVAELTQARGQLRRLVDAVGGIATLEDAIFAGLDVDPEDDRDTVLTPASLDGAFDGPGLRRAVEAMLEKGSKTDQTHGSLIAAWLDDPAGRNARFEDYERAFFTNDGPRRTRLITKPALAEAPGADAVLAAEADRIAAVRARLDAVTVARASAGLMRLGAKMLDDYAARTAIGALLDFDDLIIKARGLLAERAAAAWVLYKLDGGIDHILIDEAQDTNQDQWEVVKALSEEFFAGEGRYAERAPDRPRTVFAVGDVKQSIFSFQGADPDGFADMRAYFDDKITSAGEAFREVGLDVSFRSTSAVLQAVDAVFAGTAARDGVSEAPVKHIPERADAAGLVELWPSVKPRDTEDEDPWTPPVERTAADAPRARLASEIAATVHRWIASGERRESTGAPIRPSDVMVLVRRRRGFVEELVRALRRLEVPVAGVDRLVLSDQIAVMDLAALARFLALPQDDLTLAALLKSPLIGLNEDQLFALAYDRGDENLWATLTRRAGDDDAFAQAHGALADLLARADFAPPFELLARVVEATGGRAAFAARLGHEAEDAVDEFLSLALDYERAHTPSLQGFLHWLDAGETIVTRDLEQGERDEVRVMTIHGSKGLQAPIVFLADTMALPPTRTPLILWPGPRGPRAPIWAPTRRLERSLDDGARAAIDAKRLEEYRRLLYVAMTRAEDRLYVCGWETQVKPKEACWYHLIEAGLAGEGAPATFDFGGGWAGEGRRIVTGTPKPPHAAETAQEKIEPLPDWASRLPAPEPIPPRPFAPSQPSEDDPPVRTPLGADDGARFRRGLIIHRLLQSLPDLPPGKRVVAAKRFLARPGHGLDAAAREALLAETMAVLEAPEHAALFGPGSVAEVPVTGVIGDQVISGQVDRLCVTAEAVTILDYKTNRPPPERIEEVAPLYLRQMAAYRAVLQKVYPGREVRAALLWTDGPSLMVLPDEALDRHLP